jgi:hypothetical protein
MRRGEHEPQTHLCNALRNHGRRQLNANAELLQQIGAAAAAGDTAVAVLAYPRATGGGHQHGAGADIKGVRAVATGAHDVHQVRGVRHLHRGGELAHDLGGGGDLADRFFFYAQAGDQGRGHDGRQIAAHDQAHEMQHFVVKYFAVFNDALQRVLRCDGHDGLGW